ncbi:MAG: hypothetical protein HZT40_12085 [Candidatus Thiothrix singaporensis]|uniref:Uncharacterized protein n=1 Tax=Candidatus Thiothrix singaporensis TaxID=2799669 RepID=A0A7L6ASX8_9GAMM|nr:MAG: hypothetical protein HZT40_12085 [Candidatus Thiothrix singaporensis]
MVGTSAGENDALVTYAYLPASPLVLYGETGLVMAYGFPGAVNGALNFYNSPSWIGGIGALCSDIGLSRGNVGTAATILGTALGIENQSYNIYYGKRQ